jgi:Ca-activated chloride channel family protein
MEALTQYQEDFRLPTIVVFVTDYSSSMMGTPEEDLENGLRGVSDYELASKHLLQAHPDDIRVMVPFASEPGPVYTARGPKETEKMIAAAIQEHSADGGTALFDGIILGYRALRAELDKAGVESTRFRSTVIVMTDGNNSAGGSLEALMKERKSLGLEHVPTYTIVYGDADLQVLEKVAKLTGGQVCEGTEDLSRCYRESLGSAF